MCVRRSVLSRHHHRALKWKEETVDLLCTLSVWRASAVSARSSVCTIQRYREAEMDVWPTRARSRREDLSGGRRREEGVVSGTAHHVVMTRCALVGRCIKGVSSDIVTRRSAVWSVWTWYFRVLSSVSDLLARSAVKVSGIIARSAVRHNDEEHYCHSVRHNHEECRRSDRCCSMTSKECCPWIEWSAASEERQPPLHVCDAGLGSTDWVGVGAERWGVLHVELPGAPSRKWITVHCFFWGGLAVSGCSVGPMNPEIPWTLWADTFVTVTQRHPSTQTSKAWLSKHNQWHVLPYLFVFVLMWIYQ